MFVENLNTNVHSSLVCARQRPVSAQASFSGWIAKQLEYVLQQFVIVAQQDVYTSDRELAMGTQSLVTCWEIILSGKSQPPWFAV